MTRAALLAGLLLMLGATPPAHAGDAPQPPGSFSFGHSLAQWQAIWLAWEMGALAPPTDAIGNALVNGVVLLPIPAASGDGTPASLNITLLSGEPFVVPLILVVGDAFSNGSTSPMVSSNDFKNISLTLTLDGETILDSDEAFRFYTQTVFNPPIPLNEPPVTGIAWVQGLSIAHTPLRPGNHVLKLDEKITLPERGTTLEFHNTLNITVMPSQ